MATTLKKALDVQDQQVWITDKKRSLDGAQIRSLDERLKAQLDTQASGGIVPTKRDEIGNILLYEDPVFENSQLQRTDQYISIGLVKPDYDDEQVKEVLDLDIKELFTTADLSEIERLRKELEDARKDLRDANARIIINETIIPTAPTEERPGEPTGSFSGEFPKIVHILPDLESGLPSASDLKFGVNTSIFNDETYTLENMGSPNPVSIKWWVIDHMSEIVFAKGVSDTLYDVEQDINGFSFLEYSIDLDVVLMLENIPSNFNGWYVNDQSQGVLEEYTKFSDVPEVRFRFMRRKGTGIPFIDEHRNFYYILATFLREPPVIPSGDITKVNVTTAKMLDGFVGVKSSFNVEMSVTEFDAVGNRVGGESITVPYIIVGQTGNTVMITTDPVVSDAYITGRIGEENRYRFDGWYGSPNHVTGVSAKLGNDLSITVELKGVYTNIVAGYVIDDTVPTYPPLDDPPSYEPPMPDPPDEPLPPDEPVDDPRRGDWNFDPSP